jgi:hypothetical protein
MRIFAVADLEVGRRQSTQDGWRIGGPLPFRNSKGKAYMFAELLEEG